MSHQHSVARAGLLTALLVSACGTIASKAQPGAQPEAHMEAAPAVVEPRQADLQPVVAEPRLNVLENGGFEALDELLAPEGWSSARASSFRFVEGGDDNHYAQLEARGDDGARRIFRRFVLDPGWKALRATARMKASGLRVGDKPWRDAHIVLTFYGQDGKPLKFTRPIALTASSGWKLLAGQEAIPPGAQECEIEIANYAQAGTLAVDDVGIEPDGALEAPLLRPGFPEGRFEAVEPQPPGEQQGEQAGRQPAGWPIEGLPGVSLAEEEKNHFLRFANNDAAGHVRAETIWRLQKGVRFLRVSARMRASELKMGKGYWQTARVGLGFTDALGVDFEQYPPALELHASSGWRTVSVTFAVPSSARFLKIMPELMQARGVLDVDDIQVQQLL